MQDAKIITTGVDKLVQLVKQQKRISIENAAKALSVPKILVEEWTSFLEEKEVIGIEYKLATPYLFYRTITKKETDTLYKEFDARREGFIRKVESALKRLDNESQGFVKFKKDFEMLMKEMNDKVKGAKEEFNLVRKYDEMKKAVDMRIFEEQESLVNRRRKFEQETTQQKRIINGYLQVLDEKRKELNQEKTISDLLIKSEVELQEKLNEIVNKARTFDDKVKVDNSIIKDTSKRISNLSKLITDSMANLKNQEQKISPLVKESQDHEKKIRLLKEKFLKKVAAARKTEVIKTKELKFLLSRFQAVFSKKLAAEKLVNKLDTDVSNFKHDLEDLSQYAMTIKLRTKLKTPTDYLNELEAKLHKLTLRKRTFRGEVDSILKIFK